MIGRREDEGEAKPAEHDTAGGAEEELSLIHGVDAGVGEEGTEGSGRVRPDRVEDEDDPFKT